MSAVEAGAALRRALRRDGDSLELLGERLEPAQPIALLAVGKAALPMAEACEAIAGAALRRGLCVHAGDPGAALLRSRKLQGSHPVPDARSAIAGRAVLDFVAGGEAGELLVVLLSGGASALMACAEPGLETGDLARTTALLLEAGADIEATNVVRKHLSAVAGGKLASRASAQRICVLAISDVPPQRFDLLGSGPFAADPSDFGAAIDVLRRFALLAAVPAPVRRHLEAGARGERRENPKPGDPDLARVRHECLADNAAALRAAEERARSLGFASLCVSERLRGEARVAGRRLGALLRSARPARPTCLVAGGETVVAVRGAGRGGRSQELALAAALELAGQPGVALLAAGTDGVDGPTSAAGAFCDGGSVARGRAAGVEASQALAANDSHGFFRAEGGLFEPGPTGTNVRDLVLMQLDPSALAPACSA